MAKDSAEKGLSEEAVKLFDLAKVHVHLFYTDISFTKDQYFLHVYLWTWIYL